MGPPGHKIRALSSRTRGTVLAAGWTAGISAALPTEANEKSFGVLSTYYALVTRLKALPVCAGSLEQRHVNLTTAQ